jgi:hypothetical protein
MIWHLTSYEWERIFKEVIMVFVEILPRHLPERAEKNHDRSPSG